MKVSQNHTNGNNDLSEEEKDELIKFENRKAKEEKDELIKLDEEKGKYTESNLKEQFYQAITYQLRTLGLVNKKYIDLRENIRKIKNELHDRKDWHCWKLETRNRFSELLMNELDRDEYFSIIEELKWKDESKYDVYQQKSVIEKTIHFVLKDKGRKFEEFKEILSNIKNLNLESRINISDTLKRKLDDFDYKKIIEYLDWEYEIEQMNSEVFDTIFLFLYKKTINNQLDYRQEIAIKLENKIQHIRKWRTKLPYLQANISLYDYINQHKEERITLWGGLFDDVYHRMDRDYKIITKIIHLIKTQYNIEEKSLDHYVNKIASFEIKIRDWEANRKIHTENEIIDNNNPGNEDNYIDIRDIPQFTSKIKKVLNANKFDHDLCRLAYLMIFNITDIFECFDNNGSNITRDEYLKKFIGFPSVDAVRSMGYGFRKSMKK